MSGQHTFTNLVDMFESSIERYGPRKLFGVKRDGVYRWSTYAELGTEVADLRGGLAALGVGPGDRVGIIANNSPQWAAGAYATYSLGAQYVPMYEAQLPKDWKYILSDSGVRVLLVANQEIEEATRPFVDEITTLEHVVNMTGTTDDARSYDGLLALGQGKPTARVQPDPEDVCGFIYTSGTTGQPKGVLLTHHNITSNINAVHSLFPMDREDVSLSFLPWAHSFGQTCELHCLLSYGASIGLAESVTTIVANLAEVRPTLLFSVPRIFNRIYDGVQKKMAEAGGLKKKLFDRTMVVASRRRALAAEGRWSLPTSLMYVILNQLVSSKVRARFGGRLKYAFSGGAALSKAVGEFIDNLGITVYEGYGLTETSPIVCANRPEGQRIGSVGQTIPGVDVRIIPADSAPEGQGEIVVYGPNVMKGYHNLAEETAAVTTDDGGFRTGDMGRLDPEGFLWITGRVKEQYKLENGKYVVPAPLEEELKLSPFINQVLIDGSNRPYNIALVVPELDAMRAWAKGEGLVFADDRGLCALEEVHAKIGDEIETRGAGFKGYERPRRWALTAEEFSPQNDMLTPTLKLKRRIVMTHYGPVIETLYA